MAKSDQNTDADDKTEVPQVTPQPRRWVKLLFGVSLALNILVIAAVGSAAWRFIGPEQTDAETRIAPSPTLMLIRALPREDREALRRGFVRAGGNTDEGETRTPTAGERRGGLLQILRQSPFDAGSLEALLKRHARFSHQRAENGAAALAVIVADMSDEQRADYAREVEKLFRRAERRRVRR